ncbi:hypothetical protein [Bradyrhizobium sp. USDA 4454]
MARSANYPTGAGVINQRGVPHAGFKIGGDKTLKLINVFVVDKGKPKSFSKKTPVGLGRLPKAASVGGVFLWWPVAGIRCQRQDV